MYHNYTIVIFTFPLFHYGCFYLLLLAPLNEAWEKTTITQIQAQRDALIKYLELSFDERSQNFRFLFEKVDNAIASGDNNQLNLALHSIVEIAKSSPFRDFADLASVRTALDDPDHNWKF